MIPRIEFKYSWIYDRTWENWLRSYYKKSHKRYPSQKEIQSFIKKIRPLWRKEEKRVLRELSKIAGLPWKSKTITCYVVGGCRPFSDPLTLRVMKNPQDFIDTLTHELIHQLFTQEGNLERYAGAWKRIYSKYKKDSITTKIHVPLHAIHEHILRKFWGGKRLERQIDEMKGFRDYRRAWEIVQKNGYQRIIEEMRR